MTTLLSGSPIIQNGKLVGAVTHVFVNDPTHGYRIFIENKEISLDDAIKILKREKSAFFKPISIGKGIGIFRIDYRNKKFYLKVKKGWR